MPQWSPPLNGGVTVREHFKVRDDVAEPQWSPPLNGGVTPLGAEVPGEPFWPQWSPPLNGGVTAREIRTT